MNQVYNNHLLTIGIEVHVVLKTNSKMFSTSKAGLTDPANTNIHPIDLGLPGTMPQPNHKAVLKGILLAYALHMAIEDKIQFDRKNYFYQDLPKGFQITQFFHPVGTNGIIQLDNNQVIKIKEIHLEEDSAKQIVINNQIYLDYNRAGLPLIEIVTEPCMHHPNTAMQFLRWLRKILVLNGISTAKMEDGCMRVDVNVSWYDQKNQKPGTRVEIKNINSIANVGKAIEYEANWQMEQILANQTFPQATKRFNDVTNTTEFMRYKTQVVDYHYMVEPNIFVRQIPWAEWNSYVAKKYVDVFKIANDLQKAGISMEFVNMLLDNATWYQTYLACCKVWNEPTEIVKWLCIELNGQLTKNNLTLESWPQERLAAFYDLLKLLATNKLNGKQGKEIVKLLVQTNDSVADIIEQHGFVQITDLKILANQLQQIVEANKPFLLANQANKTKIERFLMGKIMQLTKGQANPQAVVHLLEKMGLI